MHIGWIYWGRLMTRTALLIAFSFLLLLLACERHEREQGGVQVRGDTPVSQVTANVSNVPGLSNVAEVAPKSGNGGVDGQEVYTRVCAACHQANGQGVPGAFPPLDGSPYVTGPNIERMASIMLYGLMGPITVKGTTYNGVMLPQGAVLNDAELSAVANYVRSSWSNKAPAFEPAIFAKMRQKWGTRAQFNIQELGEEK